MSMQDTIADALHRIRNAQAVGQNKVQITIAKYRVHMHSVKRDEG